MPIPLPNLDDRRYEDLVEEALALIPNYAPDWTNHNDSDPGITLVQLFAYLTEMLIYRLNRVTDANVCTFLKLIDGVSRRPSGQNNIIEEIRQVNGNQVTRRVKLADAVREVVLELRKPDRAVTCEDFERLALGRRVSGETVARARCVAKRNLEAYDPDMRSMEKPGHMSLIIVPQIRTELLLFDGVAITDLGQAMAEALATFPLNKVRGEFLYVGTTLPFAGVRFDLSVKGVNYSIAYEYFDGSKWRPLTEDDDRLIDFTSGWSSDGLVMFTPPSDWTQTSVGGVNGYWIRMRTETDPRQPAIAVRVAVEVAPNLQPGSRLIGEVKEYLDHRRLLTTRVHVNGPRYVTVGVQLTLFLKPDAIESAVRQKAIEELLRFFHPLVGGQDKRGWPFGRSVYVSEVYELLDRAPGVDFVTRKVVPHTLKPIIDQETQRQQVELTTDDANRLIQRPSGELIGVKLFPDELVDARIDENDISIVSPLTVGGQHQE